MIRATANRRRLSILLVIAANCASTAQQGRSETPSYSGRMYDVGGRGRLSIWAPNSWQDERVETSESPPGLTVRFTPPSGNAFKLLVTALPNPNRGIHVSDSKQVHTLLTELVHDALATSVEQELKLVELKGKAGSGYSYTLTDKAPKPGEFPLVTGGLLEAGEFIILFTILHRDFGEDRARCLEAVRSIQFTPIKDKTAAVSGKNERPEILLRACESGDGLACGLAAEFAARGSNPAETFKLSSKGCSLGSAFACATLGALYDHGQGVSKDEAQAVKYFKMACDKNNGLGCLNLAAMTFVGRGGLEKNENRAKELLLHACEFGNSSACKGYPQAVGAPDEKDKKAYCDFFGKGCSTNDAESCNYAAWCADSGFAGPKDEQLVKSLYEKACASTSPGACFHLAEHESDSGRALGLYRKSCERGYGYACFILGKRLNDREDRNPSEVNGYFRRACEGDVAESCAALIGLWVK